MSLVAPRIACLGWGSLCWNPGELRTSGGWRADGPELPLEFTRASDKGKGRLTLVITPGVSEVQCLWTLLTYGGVAEAAAALREREGCALGAIGRWPGADEHQRPGGNAIGAWARAKGLDDVTWTALRPKFRNVDGQQPANAQEALEYLLTRPAGVREEAEEYVRKAPIQIRTAFRKTFEEQLGGTPLSGS